MSSSPLFDGPLPTGGRNPSSGLTHLQATVRRICFALAFCEIVKLLLSIALLSMMAFLRSTLTVTLSIVTFLRSTIVSSPQTCVIVVSAVSIATMVLRLTMWNSDTNHYLIQHFRKVISIVFACDLVLCLLAVFLLLMTKERTRDVRGISYFNSAKASDNSRYLNQFWVRLSNFPITLSVLMPYSSPVLRVFWA
jgi:predicted membrane-bound mannosyltransferase